VGFVGVSPGVGRVCTWHWGSVARLRGGRNAGEAGVVWGGGLELLAGAAGKLARCMCGVPALDAK
jgi:hypothetical protein